MSLLDFLNAKGYSGAGKIYVSPNIPRKLLSNAVSAYAPDVEPGDVLVLIDDTLFGSGKDGALLMADRMVVKESFNEPVVYPFDRLRRVSGKGNKVYAGDLAIMKLDILAKDDVQLFFTLLGKWIETRTEGGAVAPAPARAIADSAVPPELNAEQVEHVAQALLGAAQRLAPERVFVQPHIPPKKLQAALASYGGNLAADDVLVLVDDTLLGSAKEGLLLGRQAFALKMVFDAPRLFFWRHTQELHVEKRDLFVNARKVGNLTQLGSKELAPFFKAINQALEAARAAGVEAPPPSLPGDPVIAVAATASAVQAVVLPATPATPVVVPKPKARALPVVAQSSRVEVLESLEQVEKPGTKDKILSYVASAIEQNKSKIIPFLLEKTGEVSLAALRDDANVEKLAIFLYAFLPSVVRLALKEQMFVRFMLDNRDRLLEKLLENGNLSQELQLSSDAQVRTFDQGLDELLGDSLPVETGRDVLARFRALDRTLRSEAAGQTDSVWMYRLPVTFLNLLLRRLEKLEEPAREVEAQALSVLSIMYGFSFHRLAEHVRREENVFQAYFIGYVMLCDHYAQSPGATVDAQADCLELALDLAKLPDKQALNSRIRQLLTQQHAVQQAGCLPSEDILALLKEANHFAEKWFASLAGKPLEQEQVVRRRWAALLN